jgi:hypothetical protein
MNRLEIALELYKFGKADTIEECFLYADNFIALDDENAKLLDKDYQDNKSNYPLIKGDNGYYINEDETEKETINLPDDYVTKVWISSNDEFFKGAKYIEFEMPNSKARIYLLDDIKEAEKGFKVSDIKASSENKESGLGLTIFKK